MVINLVEMNAEGDSLILCRLRKYDGPEQMSSSIDNLSDSFHLLPVYAFHLNYYI